MSATREEVVEKMNMANEQTKIKIEKERLSVLPSIIENTKYARFDSDLQRRETWKEICDRNMHMHLDKFKEHSLQFKKEIECIYRDFVVPKKVLFSMRSAQFAGKSIEISPNRIYNCAYMPIDSFTAFSETMFLLLGGTGVGYSVQLHHTDKLPKIIQPSDRTYRHKIGDSIEGWADAIKALFDSYIGKRTSMPRFDYSDIRPKGTILKTSGGKAPGPEPLRKCITIIQGMLNEMEEGHQVKPIEAHDILCHIADAVLSGGIRRAAMISLFSQEDEEMMCSKVGKYWNEGNSQRSTANNSVVLDRNMLKENFDTVWDKIVASNTGEPGIYFTNELDSDWGTNPCCEIALRPFQFCNLTEINVSDIDTQEELNNRVYAAAFLGTLQATYTDFHYLREKWKTTTEKDALLGVSMTGIASNSLTGLDLNEAANVAIETNKSIADTLGINHAARVTCVKPAGTTSLVLGTSSGIHSWHSEYFIRNITLSKNEHLYPYLLEKLPHLIADYIGKPGNACLSMPQKSPEGAITRHTETTVDMLNRVKRFSTDWVHEGHIDGINTHNVSATVNVKEDEWDLIGEWLWMNRDYYNGLATIPFSDSAYNHQAPLVEITEDKFNALMKYVSIIDLTDIKEYEDNTNLQGEIACAGGECEI